MSLALAIQKNAVSLADATNTYKQNVVAVNTAMTNVLGSNMPAFKEAVPDRDAFDAAYVAARTGANEWLGVLSLLQSVPDDVMNYNDIINDMLAGAQTQAQALIANPNDSDALRLLGKDLGNLSGTFKSISTFITSTLTSISHFQNTLPQIATQLQAIANLASKDAKIDQGKIDDLTKAIQGLQDDIKSLTGQIVAAALAAGLSITLGVIASVVAFPEGLVTWFVLGPVVAGATYLIVLDAEKIKHDKSDIEDKQKDLDKYTADVATFHVLAQSVTGLATQTQAVQSNLQAVLQEWQTLETDVNNAIADINKATSSSTFQAVSNDITDAITQWNAAYAQVGSLYVQLQGNTAPLKLGMSSNEVQAALATGQTMDMTDFYNHLANSQAA